MNIFAPVVAASLLRRHLNDKIETRRFGHETRRNYIRDVGRFATCWIGHGDSGGDAMLPGRTARAERTGAAHEQHCVSAALLLHPDYRSA